MAVEDDGIDISDMPVPPADDNTDISDMPAPDVLFKQRVGRAHQNTDELETFKAHPESFAGAGAVNSEGRAHAHKALDVLKQHPFTAGIGMAENALSSTTSGIGNVLDAVTMSQPGTHDVTYRPRTAAGQQIAELGGEESANIGKNYTEAFGEGPLAETIKEYGPEAIGAVSTVAGIGGALKAGIPTGIGKAAGRVAKAVVANPKIAPEVQFDAAGTAVTPQPPPPPAVQVATPVEVAPGPITGAELRAGPDPLAEPPPVSPAPTSEAPPTSAPPPASAAPEPSTAVPEGPATVNIGLRMGNGSKLGKQTVVKALKQLGVEIQEQNVHAADTEPTFVAKISRPLTEEEGNKLSAQLRQDAIIQQHADGTGVLLGPKAQEWGPYNPEYFLNSDGTRATASASSPAPSPVAGAKPQLRFTAPTAEGVQAGAAPKETQAARLNTLRDLNKLSGGQLSEVRTSAISGDTQEAGVDYTHAKPNDAGGKRMQGVIAGETNALRTAADKLYERIGSSTEGVDQSALHERGSTIAGAVGKIQKWFEDGIKNMYEQADANAKGQPIALFDNVGKFLGDESNFGGTVEGEALYRGALARARKLGLIGQDGLWKPATVEQAERFRQFVSDQYTPRTGKLISQLKDALDSDVAVHGGQQTYQLSRSMRSQYGKMMEDPTGIAKILSPDDRLGINREVPLEQVPDYVANLPKEQFNHIINVLRSAAHLGKGELADVAAQAIREIKGHMAARLLEAGSAKIQGGWSAKDFYKQLDRYSQKMPAVFREDELQGYKTLNDASNALRMDRTYKGAKVEELNSGIGAQLREKAATAARGVVDIGAHHVAGPLGPAVAEMSGLSGKVQKLIGGNPEAAAEAARLKHVEGRITKLNEEGKYGK